MSDTYNPKFDRSFNGKFNSNNNFISIKHGTQSFLLEDELNESQYIQNEHNKEIINSMMNSGLLCHLNVLNEDSDIDNSLYLNNLISSTQNFILLNIKDYIPVNVNGNIFKLAGTYHKDVNGNTTNNNNILIDVTSIIHNECTNLVYLEVWYEEIKNNDKINYYGGIDNDVLNTFLNDDRFNLETTHRIQTKWKIRILEKQTDLTTIKSIGNDILNSPGDMFVKSNVDENLYISNNENFIGGYVYAIPIFTIDTYAYHRNIDSRDIDIIMEKHIYKDDLLYRIPYNNIDYIGERSPNYVNISNAKKALDVALNVETEIDMNATLTCTTGDTVDVYGDYDTLRVENGKIVKSIVLDWSINKSRENILNQRVTLDSHKGTPQDYMLDKNVYTYTFDNLNITDDACFSLTINDGVKLIEKMIYIVFLDNVYHLTSDKENLVQDDFLNSYNCSLSDTNKQQNIHFNCSGQYIYFAWPSNNSGNFYVNGILNSAWIKTTMNLTNKNGYTVSYDIYRSQYKQYGENIYITIV